MGLPKRIGLFHDPSAGYVEAHVVELSDQLIKREIGSAWWSDPALDVQAAPGEIDRNWNWLDLEIERGGAILDALKFGVVTGDSAVQGAMLISNEPVECEGEPGARALFVEMLFAAPRNRKWVRLDRKDLYKGVGLALLRVAAELSIEAECEGRLKLDASPGSIGWYKNRGLLEVSAHRIVHEGVEYTPMELPAARVPILLDE